MTESAPAQFQPPDVLPALARLELRSLQHSFTAIRAVKELSLSIAPGEIHALCGHNGAGKSTVVRMICGLLQPDEGEILIDGQAVHLDSPQEAQRSGIAHVDQELSVISSLTISENLMLGDCDEAVWLRRRSIRERSRELLSYVGLPANLVGARLGDLSIGQQQLVEIARALGRGARVLLLDEPTATLSKTEIELVFSAVRRIAARGCAVIFVSHRLGEVIELCDRVTVMRDGEAVATLPTEGLQPREIVKLMVGMVPEAITSTAPSHTGVSLDVRELQVPGVFGPFSLQVRPGRIYALAGQVGSGTSEVLRALAGLHPDARGKVTLAGRTLALGSPTVSRRRGIAFVTSDRKAEGLFLSKDVQANLLATRLKSISRLGVVVRRKWRETSLSLASTSEVAVDRLGTRVRELSGGNQQKVLVGRNLEDPTVRVLLLDEPTRGVDVAGRRAIHDILRTTAARGVAVLFSSTELDELVDLAHTVITMREGVVICTYDDNANSASVLSDITHAA